MKKWSDISLFKFQQIEKKNAEPVEDIDKVLFACCYVYGYTEFQLDNLPAIRVSKMIAKVQSVFASELLPVVPKRIRWYNVQYDPAKLTFGQYVELCFFFTMPTVPAAHYILASISKHRWLKQSHKDRAEYFLTAPINKVIGAVKVFQENFIAFNNEYKGLFGVAEELAEPAPKPKIDKFNKRYGWTYSASCVAEYERITLDQAYTLPVRQALGDLQYLKEKAVYDEIQLKKK